LYNILMEFGVPMKVVRLIKICLNESYSKVRIGKHLFDNFPVQNGLKHALSQLLFQLCLKTCHYKCLGKPSRTEIKWENTSVVGLCR
jgi:hypothetical protein